jgi:hypothetical protein
MEIVIDLNDELLAVNSSTPDLTSMYMYMKHEGEVYPFDDWIDNPAIVLAWWLHSFKDLMQGGSGQDFNFMEGPYCLLASRSSNKISLKSANGNVSWSVDAVEFAKALSKAMNKASYLFHKMGMAPMSERFNREVADLKAMIDEM